MTKAFTLLEVMIALAISGIMMLGFAQTVVNQNKALTHFRLRAEMLNLMLAATASGSTCTSLAASGGAVLLGTCGTVGTPQTIDVLYADGTRVDTGSDFLLRGDCRAGYYALQVKAVNPAKKDPFNNQALGAAFIAPAAIRFGMTAWSEGCP